LFGPRQYGLVYATGSAACGGRAASPSHEGRMVSGYPSDITENALRANIVAAGYST